MAAQNMIMVNKLLAYIDEREAKAYDNQLNMEEFDPVRDEEQAILDTYELLRRFIKEETDT